MFQPLHFFLSRLTESPCVEAYEKAIKCMYSTVQTFINPSKEDRPSVFALYHCRIKHLRAITSSCVKTHYTYRKAAWCLSSAVYSFIWDSRRNHPHIQHISKKIYHSKMKHTLLHSIWKKKYETRKEQIKKLLKMKADECNDEFKRAI